MKVRVVLLTENDVPVSKLGPNPEAKVRAAWEMLLNLSTLETDGRDRGVVESVEILEG